ncbi:MAG: ABC transporter substrate-binding protein [bacterium]|nr:ABC transporter substrate-binding protein [bacterium]
MRRQIVIFLTVLVSLLFSGCGKDSDAPSAPETSQKAVPWRTEGFALPGTLEEDPLWAERYQPWEHEIVSGEETGGVGRWASGSCGGLIWYFGQEQDADGEFVRGSEGNYYLEIYDTGSGESETERFSLKSLGLESELGYLCDMDLYDGGHYVFRFVDYEWDEEGVCRQTQDKMIFTDLAGDVRSVELWPFYLEKRIEQESLENLTEEFLSVPILQSVSWGLSGEDGIYVMHPDLSGFYLLDGSGNILLEYEAPDGRQLMEPLRTADGELIFPVYDNRGNNYDFLWADLSEGRLRSLAVTEAAAPFISGMYGMLGDDIYYRSTEGTEEAIVRWNIRDGRRTQLFSLRTAGIETGYEVWLALREGQTPMLYLSKVKDGERREWIAALTDQKPAEEGTVRVADLTAFRFNSEILESCTQSASLETPSFSYEYENASEKEARDRIFAELSQGKGPDLLFLDREDLYLLQERGLLLEIGDLISPKLLDGLLPGALENGTVDGTLYGVPAAVRAETLAAAESVWAKDTWKLEELIGLIGEGKLNGAIRSPYLMGDYLGPSVAVTTFTANCLADSFLIDWENRKSHFDDERFIRLLEYTEKDRSAVSDETGDWLDGGESILWGYFRNETDFLDFFEHLEKEEGRIIGYPTEGSCGSYLVADGGLLAVNANIEDKEAAACFLEVLLGKEIQDRLKSNPWYLSVRKLSPVDYITEDESGRLLFLGNSRLEIPVFEDGSTALHRAKDFLESCVAPPLNYTKLNQIIQEELSAMYAEKKSAGITADIINSRIQNYLDEGN